jgi:hypothetical protein
MIRSELSQIKNSKFLSKNEKLNKIYKMLFCPILSKEEQTLIRTALFDSYLDNDSNMSKEQNMNYIIYGYRLALDLDFDKHSDKLSDETLLFLEKIKQLILEFTEEDMELLSKYNDHAYKIALSLKN